MDPRRVILEEVMLATDASTAERLRALEMLDRLSVDDEVPFLRDVLEMPDHELDRELDAILYPLVAPDRAWDLLRAAGREDRPDPLTDALSDEPTRFPLFAKAVHAAIEARARQLADADRIDAEVERRAGEIAEVRAGEIAAAQMRAVGPRVIATVAIEGDEGVYAPPRAPAVHAGTQRPALPPGIDPDAGWKPRRAGRRSLLDRF